jgi:PAS domain S-box-containing protein
VQVVAGNSTPPKIQQEARRRVGPGAGRTEAAIEVRLASERAVLDAVLKFAPVGFCLFDADLRYLMVNERLAEINGVSPEAHIGKTLRDIVPALEAQARPVIDSVLKTGRPVIDQEFSGETAKAPGVLRYWSASWYPAPRADGTLVGVAVMVEEITQRKRAEEGLRESEARFRALADDSPLFIWMADIDGAVTYANRTFLGFLGLGEPDALSADAWRRIIHPDDRAPALDAYAAAVREQRSYTVEVRYREAATGSFRWHLVKGVPRLVADALAGFIGTGVDIHDRRLTENELASLLTSAPLGVAFFDRQHRYLRINDALAAINGVPAAEHIGRTVGEILPLVAEAVDPVIDRVFESGEAVGNFEIAGATPREQGVVRHWLTGFYPVRGEGGNVEAVGAWVTEITDRKRAEDALREADRHKDEFIALLAHELRNPLAPIRNAVQILHTIEPAHPRLERTREILDRQAAHLARLVDDLLDVSRVTQGKIVLMKAPVNLVQTLQAGVELARPLIEARRHHLTVTPSPGELWVEGDATRIAQVVGNLLTNAAKYTDPGGAIELALQRDGGFAEISVKDSGVGIAADFITRAFAPFAQADRSLDRAHGGLGLGLSLVKNLVELHGGRVALHSAGKGCGSTFNVYLPLTDPPVAIVAAAPASRPGSAKRILVVDDNKDSAESMGEVLELEGHIVQYAHDGAGAIATALAMRPEVVLLDIGLPGMDGYEVARSLRTAPETGNAVLVALTGYGQAEDRARSKAAGFDHHFVKPAELSTLIALVAAPLPATARKHE